jgi:hypothetical protein
MAVLFRRYRVEMLPSDMVDGWIAPGSRGQAWEYGSGKLGFTVTGAKAIASALKRLGDLARLTQRGDDEANFVCDWTPGNLNRLARHCRLYRRRTAPQISKPQPFPSQNPSLPAPSGAAVGIGTPSLSFERDLMRGKAAEILLRLLETRRVADGDKVGRILPISRLSQLPHQLIHRGDSAP